MFRILSIRYYSNLLKCILVYFLGESYIQFYCENILALQSKNGNKIKLPIMLMTSDDTHETTLQLLEKDNYYGLDKSQVTTF